MVVMGAQNASSLGASDGDACSALWDDGSWSASCVVAAVDYVVPSQSDLRIACADACSSVMVVGTGCLEEYWWTTPRVL